MDKKELTSIQKLDKILELISKVYFPKTESIQSIQAKLIGECSEISYKQIWQILDKLDKDGFVYISNKDDEDKLNVMATFDAEMFCINGGYDGRIKRQASNKKKKRRDNIIVNSGAILAGGYVIVQILQEVYVFVQSLYHTCK